jgi:hypothetical protein
MDATLTDDTTLTTRLDTRLQELTAQLAALPDDAAPPAQYTWQQREALAHQRRDLTVRLHALRQAATQWHRLTTPVDPALTQWLAHLRVWKAALQAELAGLPSARTPQAVGRQTNLRLSVQCIDVGPRLAFATSGYSLVNSALGELMEQSGYTVTGADIATHFEGTRQWLGSLSELEQDLTTDATKTLRRELDTLLLSDAEREQQDAERKEWRDVANRLCIRMGADKTLVCYRTLDDYYNGVVFKEQDMTPLELKAWQYTQRVATPQTR